MHIYNRTGNQITIIRDTLYYFSFSWEKGIFKVMSLHRQYDITDNILCNTSKWYVILQSTVNRPYDIVQHVVYIIDDIVYNTSKWNVILQSIANRSYDTVQQHFKGIIRDISNIYNIYDTQYKWKHVLSFHSFHSFKTGAIISTRYQPNNP